jgi:hypothetical protein
MKKFSFKRILTGILALSMIGILSSCLSNNNNVPPSLQVVLQLNGTTDMAGSDTVLTAGNDSLTITSLRLIHGKDQLIRQSDSLIFPQPNPVRFSSRQTTAGPQTSNAVYLSQPQRNAAFTGTYEAFNFKIVQAPDSLNQTIPGVFYDGNGGNYSMIIKGTYNNAEFTFRSKQNFQQRLDISPPIQVPQQNASVAFIISADVKNWFLNGGGGGFLDPSDTTNTSAINGNIQGSFQIDTKSRGTGTGSGGM